MTFDITNYLKGFAITSVLINHYLNNYTTYNQGGYANGFIGLFFILSGYGIYHSLKKQFNQDKSVTHTIGRFYLKRLIRIFPLFYLAIIVDISLFHLIKDFTPLFFLGLEASSGGMFWFITAVLHCYLLAVPLYYVLKKISPWKYLLIISIVFIVVNIIEELFLPIGISRTYHFVYRRLFFSHIYLFAIGLCIPWIVERLKIYQEKIKNPRYILLLPFFFSIFFIYVFLTRQQFLSSLYGLPMLAFIIKILFLLCAILVVIMFLLIFSIHVTIRLPLQRFFIFMGVNTLPLYLFHYFFYRSLYVGNIIIKDSLVSFVLVLVLFPIFFVCCIFLNKLSKIKSFHLKSYQKSDGHR